MERILELELMDDPRQAEAYANADFKSSNHLFVEGLIRDFPHHLRTALDLGCGPGDVVIRLARAVPDLSITAVDGSGPMIALARDAVHASGLDRQISLMQGRVPGLPIETQSFDLVLSKDLLHHLPDPSVLWTEVARLGRPGGAVYVMDLVRPSTPEAARQIVDTVAAGADPILRQDFYNSLCAAFTLDEVRGQLSAVGLDLEAAPVSDRHMIVAGIVR